MLNPVAFVYGLFHERFIVVPFKEPANVIVAPDGFKGSNFC